MLPSYLLSLREGLEAALIIGILLGALRKFNRAGLAPVVWGGALSAAAISLLAAVGLTAFGATLAGKVEVVFEGITMLLAAGVLTWMIFWMRKQARTLQGELEADVRQATLQSGRKPLFALAFVAVLREGIELALFLAAAAFTAGNRSTFAGAALGLGTSILLGWSLFASILKLDLRRFFLVTGALLILFAAGLVAHGVHEFNEIGWIPVLVAPVWDTNFALNEQSIPGQILKALFGYNGNPSLSEVLAYVAYFAGIGLALRREKAALPVAEKA